MMVHLECLECQVKWEQEGFLDREALQAFLAHQEYQELREDPGQKETRDPSVPQDRPEFLETRVPLALLVLLDP